MKKTLSVLSVLILMLTSLTLTANAEATAKVSVRIEGVENCLFNETIDMQLTDTTTVADVLKYADSENDTLTITGIEDGYITDINGESAGKFGGWDGWLYGVNGVAAPVGIGSYIVKDNDSIVLYYGDYPCQLPNVNTIKAYRGILKFESYDAEYDENYNATYSWVPVADAKVLVNDVEYITDSNGEIQADTSKLFGKVSVQLDRKSLSGAPTACRLANDFTFMFNDINKDSLVNINDVTALQKHVANAKKLDEESLSVSDINNDGNIDINDATQLQKMITEMG